MLSEGMKPVLIGELNVFELSDFGFDPAYWSNSSRMAASSSSWWYGF